MHAILCPSQLHSQWLNLLLYSLGAAAAAALP